MRVLILGTGDAFTMRHFGSSALIDGPAGYVLIDCPDLILRALREATESAGWTVGPADIDDIILTHLHGDHCNGLEAFGFYRRLKVPGGADRPRPRLHAIAPVAERVWERLAPAMDARETRNPPAVLADYYDLRTLPPDGETTIAGLAVQWRRTRHPVPTAGLLVRGDAWTLGWSADTAFEQAHIDWLDAADLIVHETNVGPAHTPIEALDGLPERIRRKMRITHLLDDFDEACTTLRPLRAGEVIAP